METPTKKYHIEEYVFEKMRDYKNGLVDYVDNEKELLALPWVRAMARKYHCTNFTVSSEEEFPDTKILIVENEDCTFWWSVAFLPKDFPTTLPKFTREKTKDEE